MGSLFEKDYKNLGMFFEHDLRNKGMNKQNGSFQKDKTNFTKQVKDKCLVNNQNLKFTEYSVYMSFSEFLILIIISLL